MRQQRATTTPPRYVIDPDQKRVGDAEPRTDPTGQQHDAHQQHHNPSTQDTTPGHTVTLHNTSAQDE